jgi:death-on-curing protein
VTVFLTVQEVRDIHDDLCSEPLIDRGKLEGAFGRPQASYDERFLHQSIYKQASVLLHAICAAHAFLDGNKRTAWVATLTFLSLNGVEIDYVDPETMSDYVKEVAEHVHSEQDTAFWLAALDPANARPL